MVFIDSSKFSLFINWINSVHPTIMFSSKHHFKTISFLDMTITTDPLGKLSFKTFHKPTDKNSYLNYRFFHSQQLRNNIPYGQVLCLKRNSTFSEDYAKDAKVLSQQFTRNGYPTGIVHQETLRAQTQNSV